VWDSSDTETSLTKPEIANLCDKMGEILIDVYWDVTPCRLVTGNSSHLEKKSRLIVVPAHSRKAYGDVEL
jgi:CheY-specific phosphatase CheX